MSPTPTPEPSFRELTQSECEAMLASHHFGRLAFSFHDRVGIEPIGFVFDDGGLVFRTSPGSKLMALKHRPWVALEIDEVEGMFSWRSVVVHGTAYVLSEIGSEAEQEAYHAALATLRRHMPDTLRANDPTPARDVVMKLSIDAISGREAAL
jgi:nitroimidazol reductase NimA-like FMN-containing flavoprotein (pyridoxamine 5'-phosphate oxidase superfamily)